MDKIYKSGEFAKRIGSKIRTVIDWDNRGVLKAQRTKTGRRYYTETQALEYLNQTKVSDNRAVIIYCRVSTRNQKDDLVNQEEFSRSFCRANGIIFHEVINDFGSGLNYKRKNFNDLLERVENNEISKIIVTHKDRFIRFGFDWFEEFCNRHKTEIVVLDSTEKDVQSELVEDLISIIHVFSCRIYGLRNYKRKTTLDKVVEKEIKNVST
jgi:putative resolvase